MNKNLKALVETTVSWWLQPTWSGVVHPLYILKTTMLFFSLLILAPLRNPENIAHLELAAVAYDSNLSLPNGWCAKKGRKRLRNSEIPSIEFIISHYRKVIRDIIGLYSN